MTKQQLSIQSPCPCTNDTFSLNLYTSIDVMQCLCRPARTQSVNCKSMHDVSLHACMYHNSCLSASTTASWIARSGQLYKYNQKCQDTSDTVDRLRLSSWSLRSRASVSASSLQGQSYCRSRHDVYTGLLFGASISLWVPGPRMGPSSCSTVLNFPQQAARSKHGRRLQ